MALPSAASVQQPYDTRVIDLPEGKGRILCIADIRGDIEQLNRLVRETEAVACIHTGDFGFFEASSLDRIADKTLKHLITYSPTISPSLRNRLLLPNIQRANSLSLLAPSESQFHLSQFPQLLGSSPRLKLLVPTFVIYGACEDVRIIEKFRTKEHQVDNLTVLDEATTRVLEVGGVRLRLFGLGGAVVMPKMFDNGEGSATIAGGGGTMWTTALQIGELIDTAQRVYDPSETRLLITHSSMGREPVLSLLALALKADLTVSGGLHFRYGASFNEFSVQDEGGGNWWAKVQRGKTAFSAVYDQIRTQVEEVIDSEQKVFLDKTLAALNRSPPSTGSGTGAEEASWKNTWSWNLTDSTYGHLLLDIKEGRVSAELKSQGFNFAHRKASQHSIKPSNVSKATTNASSSSSSMASAVNSVPVWKGPKTASAAGTNGPSQSTSNKLSSSSASASTLSTPVTSLSTQLPSTNTNTTSSTTNKSAPNGVSPSSESNKADQPPPSLSTTSPLATPVGEAPPGGTTFKPRSPHTLYISQMVPPVSEAELKEFFGDASEGIVSVKLIMDKETGAQRHFAYVGFADAATMEKGLSSHATTLKTATPNVAISKPPSSGEFSGYSRGRGGRGRGGRGDHSGGGSRGRGARSSFNNGQRGSEEGGAARAD
ncbi:ser thr protein phosphatase [Phaffia rhodozyma]|uniref:Ser thr protein phosphatase n=1 Tax=Phaffia rhodozyma TaxID=264483 RepID=A0A0F7SMR3_PHARH|nr:ser thr protein phosphatase [Phaffia rhodozyma]